MSSDPIVLPKDMDWLLGGVIPSGALMLAHGPKGGGKSSLAAQLAEGAHKVGARVGFVLTEQSAAEHADQLRSMGISPTAFDIREVGDPAALVPTPDVDLQIVDSLSGFGQSRTQEYYDRIIKFFRLSKRRGVATFAICHQVKSGAAAGPSTWQHAVDVVARLGPAGAYHYLQVEKRRRLGPWAAMDMPADIPLVLSTKGFSPSPFAEPAVASTAGYARDQLVGVEALISLPPRRLHCPFLPVRRIRQLLTTLESVVGINVEPDLVGLSILVDGPYAATLDLALAVAIAASYRRKPLVQDAVFIGGVGLRGQVQPLANEGQAIGMAITDLPARIYVSSASAGLLEEMVPSASQILGVASINECLAKLKLL